MDINLNTAKKAIIECFKANLVPYLHSQPGVGKSQLAYQIADEHNLEVIDIRLSQLESYDLNGIPKIGEKSSYIPFDIFPLANDKLPKGKEGWMLFLDEISNAQLGTLHAAYKLILDRMVGNHLLHEDVYIIAAGNREEDNCGCTPMPEALKSRMVHLNLSIDKNVWQDWAVNNHIDYRITSFIDYKPALLNTFNPESAEQTYACPRTWEFASCFISHKKEVDLTLQAILAGTLGHGVATEFGLFIEYFERVIRYEDIVKNPTTVEVPNQSSDLGLLYATTSTVVNNFDIKDINPVVTFLARIPQEFEALVFTNLVRKYPGKILAHPALATWRAKYYDAVMN